MPQAYDYISQLKQPDFLERFTQGLQAGSLAAQTAQQRQAAQQAATLKAKYGTDLKDTFAKNTPEAWAQLTALYPQQREAFKQSSEMMKEGEIEATGKVYNALLSDNPGVALGLVDERITAMENSGIDASGVKRIKAMIENDPATAKGRIGMVLSSLMEPKEFKERYVTEPAGKWRVMTTDEKKKLGLSPDMPLQMASDGKISQIGGKGVSVVIEGKPQFGKIPPGFQMTEKDGSWFMEAIPGSPADTKAKVLAKKKEKQSTLETRTGNVVLEDIGRFKEKIQTAPWYNPVLGVSGYIASYKPETNRVDAENLQQTIVANIGFDRLQQMREASPTGGALGAISERELSTLQAVMGSLSLSQSEDQLIENIDRLSEIYEGILKKAQAYPGASEFGFSGGEAAREIVETRIAPDGRKVVKYSDGTYGIAQ